jgi:UDP-glucuronate 4-epimerase
MKILITGCAGFIGSFVSQTLLERGEQVLGLDNLNNYYDVNLKRDRLSLLQKFSNFQFEMLDVSHALEVRRLIESYKPTKIIHLAAQAGVRHSINNPQVYIDANIQGFLNVLEACRACPVEHLVYASSSSVYGANTKVPYSELDLSDHPISLYAASKKSNELMAHAYSDLFKIPTTGLRFFTVYGPWGRPDMAYFSFTQKILSEQPIELYNWGRHKRDFTFIDDIVEGVLRVVDKPPKIDSSWSSEGANNKSRGPYALYNIGNNQPEWITDFVDILQDLLDKKAVIRQVPQAPGDVFETFADISSIQKDFGFVPKTDLRTGLSRFVSWYRNYYKI